MPDKGSLEKQEACSGQNKVEVEVKECAIHSVVVYQDRAEVRRVVPANLAAGENEVIINGLAECVDKDSIRVEGQGEGLAVITDVTYSSQTTSKEKEASGSKEEYQRLQVELREAEKELCHLGFRAEVLKKEKELLAQFADHVAKVHSMKGEGECLGHLVAQDTVAMVMEFFEKHQAKMAALDDRLLAVQEERKKVEERIKVLRANADKINPDKKVVSKETVRSLQVSLEAQQDMSVSLIVSYVVSNASWSSAYDVRVFTKDKAMKLQYYGLIKQATGEDWKDAKISLSTAQPSIGGSAPPLPTRIIRFKRPPPRIMPHMALSRGFGGGGYHGAEFYEYDPTIEDCYEDAELEAWSSNGAHFRSSPMKMRKGRLRRSSISPPPSPPALNIEVAQVSSGLFNTTYAIPRATTIPADSTEHKVTVALIDLAPEFHYISVPRLSPHSFLQAKTKNSSPYTMLAGPANIFLDNNFITKSELSDVSPNEDFTTSLGADQSIRITCHPVAAVHGSKSGVRSKSSVVTYTHLFHVKNTRADTVKLQVSEQVPLSTDDRIKVNIQQPDLRKQNVACSLPYGHAVLNDSNNIEWHASLGPDTELELKLMYLVEYPLQDGVEGLPKS